jgi:uncharacterized protein (DUF2141 family)
MFKKLITLFINLFLISNFAYAEENYTISGDVTFQNDGDIYICLCTQEEFQNLTKDLTKHVKLSRLQCKLIGMNPELRKTGKVSFRFDDISKGTYGILTLQDVNKNGELDFLGLMYDEPYASYKELPSWESCPSWSSIKFDLEKDLTGIKIQM